jgi:hypothetical protein
VTIGGSSGADVVDISGLTSPHRVVFTGNGGSDRFLGGQRPQDVFDSVGEESLPVIADVLTPVIYVPVQPDAPGLNRLDEPFSPQSRHFTPLHWKFGQDPGVGDDFWSHRFERDFFL